MSNTTERFGNFTPITTVEDCLNGQHFGFLFSYSIMALCFLLGTPAHLCCLWFYFGIKQRKKKTQVFLLNHTIMEIIYCLECGIEVLNMYVFNNDILWNVLFFLFGLSWIGRPLLQICICIEQYMAVIHPVAFLRYKDIKYRIAVVVAAWILAFVYGVYEGIMLFFPDIIYASLFIIALAVISFCCMSVLYALNHPGPGDTHNTKQDRKNEGNQQKRNAFNTIFLELLLILFTYFPQAVLILFTGNDGINFLLKCIIVPLMTSCNVVGVIVTPFLKLYKENHIKCLIIKNKI